jgi:hypothetical protein
MAEAEQTPSTVNLDFPLPLLQAVQWTTSQGFDLGEVWEAFEQALLWDRIHAWDPRREHFEGLVPYLQDFSQAGTPSADTDVILHRGRIRGSTWRQWLADGSLNRETGTIARLFEGRRPHVEGFEPVLESADVRCVYSVLAARCDDHAKHPPTALVTGLSVNPGKVTMSVNFATAANFPVVPATENVTVEPFYSGGPGRPSAMEVILAEFERRISKREVIPRQGGLSTEAKHLAQWWTTTKPDSAPAAKAGTVEIRIRERWNSLINKT